MKLNSIIMVLFLSVIATMESKSDTLHRFHLDHKSGLSNNYIRSISQDRYGFVWVATDDGLNRFDGRNFNAFTKENSGLSSNEINVVLPDPKNEDVIWISTRHDGLCRYDYKTGKISRFNGELCSPDIPYISLSSDKKIWITHYHTLPEKIDPETGSVEPLMDNVPEGMPRAFWCVEEDPDGRFLYIGHDGGGFSCVDLRTKRYVNYQSRSGDDSIGGDHVNAIHIDDTGVIWLGTESGISIYNPANGSFFNITHGATQNSLLPGEVRCIREMSNGDLWFGTTQGGVSILSSSKRESGEYDFVNLTHYSRGYSRIGNISSPCVYSLFEDSYGNKWVGNYSDGIDVVSYEPPFFIQEEPFPTGELTYKHQAVWSVISDRDGRIWMGGENKIKRMDGKEEVISYLPPTAGYNALVKTMYCDSRGKIWIGTSNSGVYIYDPSADRFDSLQVGNKDIHCFAESPDGKMLIGTYKGVYVSENYKDAAFDKSLSGKLGDLYVRCMEFDLEGSLWLGTFGQGVTVVRSSGESVMINKDRGLPINTINDICVDSQGHIWLATREGAVRISVADFDEITLFSTSDGLLNCDVKAVEEDMAGNVWLSTNNGIGCYNLKTGKLLVYERTYGNRLASFTEGSSCMDPEGRIFFGSLNGLTHFNSRQVNKRIPSSNILLTGIMAHDSDGPDQNVEIVIPVGSETIRLPHNMNTFTIRFCNPDITQAANTDYSYNMKDVNEVWTKVSEDNEAIYRNLKPGEYDFQVRHRLNGEEWSEPLVLAHIIITPPLYQTWWAKLLYIISAITVIGIFFYFYKHKVDLEKNLSIEKENGKNIQKLNEERMVFFTNITHELRTPLSLIVGPIEDLVNDRNLSDEQRRKLHTIRNSSMRLLNLINGILEFRKTETRNRRLEVVEGRLANHVREIGLRFKELNSNKDVSIVIDVARMEDVDMYYDPEMITSILNNLLGNAIKYTKKGRITISMKPVDSGGVRYVDLSVSDTGEGISKDALPYIFQRYYQAHHNRKVAGTGIGLALTKNLVELHEGSISVASEVGHGSVFTVRLLIDNSYPDAIHREETGEDMVSGDNIIMPKEELTEKLSVLVVEDDDDMRDYIVRSFEGEFRMLSACDGKDGLELARREIPDIIVSDIMMPLMDGMEMCRILKGDVTVSHIPLIFLTAKDSLPDKEEGYECGAHSYITKPFSASLLRSRIFNILEERHKLSLRLLGMSVVENSNGDSLPREDINAEDQDIKMELSPLDREFIEKLDRLILDNLEVVDLDIAYFTDKMCMSHSTLYRKVKSLTGITPSEYIRRLKLKRAAEYLVSGEVYLGDIPYKTGFNSPAYFRRVFKKEYGMSATEYMERHRRI